MAVHDLIKDNRKNLILPGTKLYNEAEAMVENFLGRGIIELIHRYSQGTHFYKYAFQKQDNNLRFHIPLGSQVILLTSPDIETPFFQIDFIQQSDLGILYEGGDEHDNPDVYHNTNDSGVTLNELRQAIEFIGLLIKEILNAGEMNQVMLAASSIDRFNQYMFIIKRMKLSEGQARRVFPMPPMDADLDQVIGMKQQVEQQFWATAGGD